MSHAEPRIELRESGSPARAGFACWGENAKLNRIRSILTFTAAVGIGRILTDTVPEIHSLLAHAASKDPANSLRCNHTGMGLPKKTIL